MTDIGNCAWLYMDSRDLNLCLHAHTVSTLLTVPEHLVEVPTQVGEPLMERL